MYETRRQHSVHLRSDLALNALPGHGNPDYKQGVALRFADLVYYGQWFTPLREALSAFVDVTQQTVTGDVKGHVYKGNIMPRPTQALSCIRGNRHVREDECTFNVFQGLITSSPAITVRAKIWRNLKITARATFPRKFRFTQKPDANARRFFAPDHPFHISLLLVHGTYLIKQGSRP